MKVEDALAQLRGVRRTGDRFTALCPSHNDHNPSLSVREGTRGNAVFKCFANKGCTHASILAALESKVSGNGHKQVHNTATGNDKPKIITPFVEVAQYDYRDEAGALVCQNVRKEATGENGAKVKTFAWRQPGGQGGWLWHLKGVRRVPYRLPELLASNASATVFLTEGE